MGMSAPRGKIKGYLLVRDKDGNPKIDNPSSVPQEIWDKFSESDRIFANNAAPEEFKRLD